jgi:hypothetical protein
VLFRLCRLQGVSFSMPLGNKSFSKVRLCSRSRSFTTFMPIFSPTQRALFSFLCILSTVHCPACLRPISGSNAGIGVSFFWVLMVGIAYQRSPYDPFENSTQCQLDAALMKTLGANAIRSTVSCPQFISLQPHLPILSFLSFGLRRGKSTGKLLSARPRRRQRNCAST